MWFASHRPPWQRNLWTVRRTPYKVQANISNLSFGDNSNNNKRCLPWGFDSIRNFFKMALRTKGHPQPLLASILLYKMLATSKLQFVLQMLRLPSNFETRERNAMMKVHGGTWNSVSKRFRVNMQTCKCFPLGFPSIKSTAFAAASRTILETLPRCRKYYDMIGCASRDDDAQLLHPFPKLLHNSFDTDYMMLPPF